jgi:mycothiol synthase
MITETRPIGPTSTDLERLAVTLPDAPAMPGLRFRRWAGPSDLVGMVPVCNAAHRADGDPELTTLEMLAVDYAHLTNCDPETDILLAEVDGVIVAYGRVFWEDFTDGTRGYHAFAFLHPDWRRRGIGRAMLHHFERHNLAIGASHDTDRTKVLISWGYDRNEGNTALLRDEGYEPTRHFVLMVRPTLDAIEVTPMPQGLRLRPGHPEQARDVFAADTEAFRDHWGGVDESDAAYERWRGHPHWDPSLWMVAWDGDQVAGAVLNKIDPDENGEHGYLRGWLDSVFVRRPWRQRGLGGALIGRSLMLLRERGMTSAQLGVDVDNVNRALSLYTGAGFAVHQSETVWRKPWPVVGVTGAAEEPSLVRSRDG